ncbi:MAG: tetratricopeptide repeat protein [Phycisphaeraceae bacterium]|nr:tetratricopeptide repeat protein [Phycisphaeraceae bacterium]
MTSITSRRSFTRRPRIIGRLAAALVASAAAALTGCQGHGKYTSEFLDQANDKVALMKGGTEWNAAYQAFLAGELDKALKSVDSSIAITDKMAKSHTLRGRILIEKGDLDAARRSLLTAEKLDPKADDVQYYIGIIHERFGEADVALQRYEKAMELSPSNAQYLIAAAEMLIQLDRLDDASTMLSSHSSEFQYNAALRQSQGHIAMLRNQTETAVRLFSEARLLAPDNVSILEDLSRAQFAAGAYADAEYNFSKLIEGSAKTPRRDLEHLRAMCLMKLDRLVDARTLLLALTQDKQGENDAQTWIDLANVCRVLKDYPRLKIASGRVIVLAPNRYEGYMLRAVYLRRTGDNPGALASLRQAQQRTTKDASPYLLAALIEQDMGQNDAAMASLEKARKIDPSSETIDQMRQIVSVN